VDSKRFDEVQEMANELEEYAEMEGTELGELCGTLCSLMNYFDYTRTEEFESAVAAEIEQQLAYFKKHSKVVETEETHKHTVIDLEWNT